MNGIFTLSVQKNFKILKCDEETEKPFFHSKISPVSHTLQGKKSVVAARSHTHKKIVALRFRIRLFLLSSSFKGRCFLERDDSLGSTRTPVCAYSDPKNQFD